MLTETTTATQTATTSDDDLEFNPFGSDDDGLQFDIFADFSSVPARKRPTRSKVAIASVKFAAMAAAAAK